MTADEMMWYCSVGDMQVVAFYGLDSGREIYRGLIDDAPDGLRFAEISSWDITNDVLTFNMDEDDILTARRRSAKRRMR